jgi:hypothetical protein
MQTIAELTVAGIASGDANGIYQGQGVTTPQGSSFNSLRFSWLTLVHPGFPSEGTVGIPAVGSIYILTQEYLGIPAALSFSTPGFLARSVLTEGAEFVFNESATLAPGTRYWFYGDTRLPGLIFTSSRFVDQYPGGDFYSAGQFPTNNFSRLWLENPNTEHIDTNFRLTGRPLSR